MRARAYVPTLLAIGLVVSVISSLGAPLIPSIAEDLHASLSSAQWSLTATLLVGAVASPFVGRLGDGPHRRTVLLVCLGIVTLGGALAALAASLPLLVLGRAMQGLGLALMPLTMASARDHLPTERAVPTIALLSVIGAAGVGSAIPSPASSRSTSIRPPRSGSVRARARSRSCWRRRSCRRRARPRTRSRSTYSVPCSSVAG